MNTQDKGRNRKVLSYILREPISAAKSAAFDIHAGNGNLTIGQLPDSKMLLAEGMLEYAVRQGAPLRNRSSDTRQAVLSLKTAGHGLPWFKLPWSACNGATLLNIRLNPALPSAITARSAGGNIKLDLTNLCVTQVTAETGGGNIDLRLPKLSASLSAAARTGAGNVNISLPEGIEARINAPTGLGKINADASLIRVDAATYQTANFEQALIKMEITANSGAGNVNIFIN